MHSQHTPESKIENPTSKSESESTPNSGKKSTKSEGSTPKSEGESTPNSRLKKSIKSEGSTPKPKSVKIRRKVISVNPKSESSDTELIKRSKSIESFQSHLSKGLRRIYPQSSQLTSIDETEEKETHTVEKAVTYDQLVKKVENLIKLYPDKPNQIAGFKKDIKAAIQARENLSPDNLSPDQKRIYEIIKPLKISETFGNNNINIVIGNIKLPDNNEPVNVVLQFYESKKIHNKDHDLTFMAEIYYETFKNLENNEAAANRNIKPELLEKKEIKKEKEKEKVEEKEKIKEEDITQVRVQIKEYFPELSLNEKVRQLHDDSKDPNPKELMQLIVTIGKQLCSLINELREKEIIWADMKSANILIRVIFTSGEKALQIAVCDPKAFFPYKTIHLTQKKENNIKGNIISCNYDTNFNERETSIAGRELLCDYTVDQDQDKAREYFRDNWPYEYLYRMGVMLYAIATGKTILTDYKFTLLKDEKGQYIRDEKNKFISTMEIITDPFDFSKPVFKTEEGQLLTELILGLCDPDPKNRTEIEKVDKMLDVIDNGLKTNEQNTFSTSTFPTTTPATTTITTTTTTTTSTTNISRHATISSPTTTKTTTSASTSPTTTAITTTTSASTSPTTTTITTATSAPTSPSTSKRSIVKRRMSISTPTSPTTSKNAIKTKYPASAPTSPTLSPTTPITSTPNTPTSISPTTKKGGIGLSFLSFSHKEKKEKNKNLEEKKKEKNKNFEEKKEEKNKRHGKK